MNPEGGTWEWSSASLRLWSQNSDSSWEFFNCWAMTLELVTETSWAHLLWLLPATIACPLLGVERIRWGGIPLGPKKLTINLVQQFQTHVVCQARVNTPFVSWDRPLSLYVKGATAGIALEPFFYYDNYFIVSNFSFHLFFMSSRGAASDSAVLSYSHQDWVENGPESGRLPRGENYAFLTMLRITKW